jgi:NAD(P)-dependent dehydrogenase (short-subunit alcohol dehydrogenase family)
MEDLSGKVAVITGAGSGIGRALASAFGAEEMRLMLADIDPTRLDVAAKELRAGGVEVATRVTDVAVGDEIEALAAATLASFGGVDLVCNNAGVGAGGLVADFDAEQWRRVVDVDLWSVLHGMRVFLPILIEQGNGHIVNTASVAGLFAAPFMGPYTISKYGVVAASETAFHELAMLAPAVGISVLCPGWVRTSIADAQIAEAEAAAAAAAASGGDDGQADLVGTFGDIIRGYIDQGMDPADVAVAVVDAVKTRRFYILTHEASVEMVRQRLDAIVSGGTPPLVTPENF